jgi:hypothetical protein
MKFEPWTDAEVIRLADQNLELVAVIFDRHHLTIHRFLTRRVGPETADDLAGDVSASSAAAAAYSGRVLSRSDIRFRVAGAPTSEFSSYRDPSEEASRSRRRRVQC